MPRQHPDDVQKELDQQDDEFYGEETYSGTNPDPESDDNVKENLKDVIGNEPDNEFNIGDEVNEDENAIASKPINDYANEETNEEEEDS